MSELTRAETAALAAIDERALGRLLLDLLAVPSVTGTAAESELQHTLAGHLHGPCLILQGHVDVVPPGDLAQWPSDPFRPRVAGDVIHGRGACDMKAGLVANLAAIAAIRASGVRLRGRIAAHCVVSEEDGGLGAFGTLQRGYTGDACIVTEPTSNTLITANGGALTFELRVPGSAAHGSTRYAGVSAMDAYLPIHRALTQLERERNASVHPLMAEYDTAYCISVGIVRAGDWASSVPDLLVAQGRLGVAIDESPEAARLALEQCVADACKRDPGSMSIPPPSHGMAARSAADGFPQATRFVIMSGTPTRPQPARPRCASAAPPTAVTCGCTRRRASRPCITAPATCVPRTVPESRSRWPMSSTSPEPWCSPPSAS
jgi:acetylornithine deacetylase